MIRLTDAGNKEKWLDGLRDSVAVAQKLGAPVLIAQAGDDLPDLSRETQRVELTEALRAATDILEGTGVRPGAEPLNTRIDHIVCFLGSTTEGLDIADEIDRPEIGIVYGIYHSAVMLERTEDVIGNRISRDIHVQIADHPRLQRSRRRQNRPPPPARLAFVQSYDCSVGLEYRPARADADDVSSAVRALG
ncbi:TIM barrel protein [Rhizobium leguminosarum]|uniref:TIM barrel protein n=1 Tax=Rhizobium leguminosarum TaxID=384 RepID=UPI0024796247|nr:TIM barrel protein [Rhizobium leguminosarum]